MIVKDASVIIHLAKITLLEKSCEHFRKVIMPETVYQEVQAGKEKGYEDAFLVEMLVQQKKIEIIKADAAAVARLGEYNVHGGEAEAIVLFKQEKADYIATDDDNVRRKADLLSLHLLGTPSIILLLYKEKRILKDKFKESVARLQKIGWFSSGVIDKLNQEAVA